MAITPHLGLPYIAAAQAQKHVTHNEALRALDALTQIGVADRDLTSPPPLPADGDRYIIAASATGAWAGHDGKITAWQDNSWMFYPPVEGWLAWIFDEAALLAFDGTDWVAVSTGSGSGSVNPAWLVGVNTTADATNRLAVSSPASLFTHEGAGHQIKVNKAIVSDTASLLFQDNWSGRAEMGLTGDDDFHFKVSNDGTNWLDAISISALDGSVSFPNTDATKPVNITMTATTQSGPAIKMVGKAIDGSQDLLEGAGLFLTHNSLNNRQFVLADTQSKKGVRFLGTIIDGYENGLRRDLILGTNTNGVHISHAPANTQFSVSNWDGIASKTVCAITGAAAQTGRLLEITSAHFGSTLGDVLVVNTNGQMDVGGPLKLKSYTVATVPGAASSGAGSMIFVSDESGGGTPAFSDGTNWLRVSDRAVIIV